MQNQSFGRPNSIDINLIQRNQNPAIANNQIYQRDQYNYFPLNQSYNFEGGLFDSMSPYHYNQQSNDLQNNNGIQTPITTSVSSQSTYYSDLPINTSGRSTNDCIITQIQPKTHHRNQRQLNLDQNYFNNHAYSNTNNLQTHFHKNNFNKTNYYHPSNLNGNLHGNLSNSAKMNGNFVDNNNEENQLMNDLRNQQNYSNQDLITNHNIVRRHRSMPADSFQKELNLYPMNRSHLNEQIHQRSSSFKLPVSSFFCSFRADSLLQRLMVFTLLKSFEDQYVYTII